MSQPLVNVQSVKEEVVETKKLDSASVTLNLCRSRRTRRKLLKTSEENIKYFSGLIDEKAIQISKRTAKEIEDGMVSLESGIPTRKVKSIISVS